MSNRPTMKQLLAILPQVGKVEWIGVRANKREPLSGMDKVDAIVGKGLQGDHYAGSSGKREVTLIQHEHLPVIASLLHVDAVHPQQLRRNIVVSGISLLALKDKRFHIGDAVLEMTGLCHPCSRMEETFGAGGYNAVRGHGGITARVISSGVIAVSDRVTVLLEEPS